MKKTPITLVLMLLLLTQAVSQDIHIASFNIRMKTNSDTGNLWDNRKEAVCNLILFHEFDIFGIQEGFIEQIKDMQGLLPSFDYIGVGRDDGDQKGEHSAIFYNTNRFDVLRSGTFWLSETNTEKTQQRLGCRIAANLYRGVFKDKLNDREFIFMNTHFDHVGKVARSESAKQILAKAKEFAADLPLILTGDFNVDENNDAYKLLANSQVVADTYEKAPIKYLPNSTFNGWGKSLKPSGRIDHIFVTPNFQVLKYGALTDTYMGKFPSDHFPVLSVLRW